MPNNDLEPDQGHIRRALVIAGATVAFGFVADTGKDLILWWLGVKS